MDTDQLYVVMASMAAYSVLSGILFALGWHAVVGVIEVLGLAVRRFSRRRRSLAGGESRAAAL